MGYKISIDDKTCACPCCGYTWFSLFGDTDLDFNEGERCLCCPKCGELIEDGDD